MLLLAAATAIGGAAALRFAWSQPTRSMIWNGAGWGLFLVAACSAWVGAGAWGLAVASLCGMGAALALLAHAALTAPAVAGAKASNRRANMLPQGREPLFLRRRIVTFLIVVFVAMFVAIGIGIATRAVALLLGASEANANVLAFFAMPLVWVWFAYALLMEHRRTRQWQMLALWAVPGVLAIILGLTS